jgi:hypothetical protein
MPAGIFVYLGITANMQALTSPLSNGACSPPSPEWCKWLGYFGQCCWQIRTRIAFQSLYLQSLKNQIRQRGALGAELWRSNGEWKIAVQVTEIVNATCWREEFSFHPEDAWAIMGKCEIGDITDIEVLYRIERIFGLSSPCDELWHRVSKGLTFGDVVSYISVHGHPDNWRGSR